MTKDFEKSTFYRAFMTCVFAGLAGTVFCMIYDLSYVQLTKFPFSSIINVSTLIFGINIIFLIIGALYYWSLKFSKPGEITYTILFAFITIFMLVKVQHFQRSNNAVINTQFRWLASGIIITLGALSAIAVPLLYHSKKFDEHVL